MRSGQPRLGQLAHENNNEYFNYPTKIIRYMVVCQLAWHNQPYRLGSPLVWI